MISNRDMFNLMGAISQTTVDQANRDFYGKITYPWPQMTYPTYADPNCGTVFLNQELVIGLTRVSLFGRKYGLRAVAQIRRLLQL